VDESKQIMKQPKKSVFVGFSFSFLPRVRGRKKKIHETVEISRNWFAV
jgi:hypothetical protein